MRDDAPMNVVVIHESRTGNTRRAAELIGGYFAGSGATTSVFALDRIDLKTLAAADLVCVGTWTDGLVLFGHRPGGAARLRRKLPTLWGKDVVAFCTYAVNPGKVAEKFARLLEGKGATIVGGGALHRAHLDRDVAIMVEALAAPVA